MGKKTQRGVLGLYKRGRYWHIDKEIFGQRVTKSTGTQSYKDAVAVLNHCTEEIRQATIFGVRPKRTFKEAVLKYLKEEGYADKESLESEKSRLKSILPFIGDLTLDAIHMGTLQPYIDTMREQPYVIGKTKKQRKNRTINYSLTVVRHILNLAATLWVDDNNLTWLRHAPKIKLLPENDRRRPYPLSWDEQDRLFWHLADHLKTMALFAVNTGCRDRVICSLKWEWEQAIPELNTSVFVVPGYAYKSLQGNHKKQYHRQVKNGEDRLIVLNQVMQELVETMRGKHTEYVFTYRGKPIQRIGNKAWQRARVAAGLPDVRVHDLKHTFGRRLRAAGVSFEDRQDLLGHKSSRITTHYSAAEISNLIAAANKVCRSHSTSPTLTLLRSCAQYDSRKSPAVQTVGN